MTVPHRRGCKNLKTTTKYLQLFCICMFVMIWLRCWDCTIGSRRTVLVSFPLAITPPLQTFTAATTEQPCSDWQHRLLFTAVTRTNVWLAWKTALKFRNWSRPYGEYEQDAATITCGNKTVNKNNQPHASAHLFLSPPSFSPTHLNTVYT